PRRRIVGHGVGEPPEQIAPGDDLAEQRLVAAEFIGTGRPQRLGDDADEEVELDREARAALQLIALEESGLRKEGPQFFDVTVQGDVWPRKQQVVENEDGVVLVEARGQGIVER